MDKQRDETILFLSIHLGRYRLGVGISVLTFWQNFFESVNKKKVYQFFWNMTKGGKLGLSPCCFLIHHNNDPLVWQPPTWSFHVPTMRNGLFQQQEWIGFLQTTFVTDSRIYLVMAFSQRACWMKTSFNPARGSAKYETIFFLVDPYPISVACI